ncbi:MAG: CPBP family intramembrane metalloprotease [Oscillospiraceae bacterium]|nr:CPBP family intramembrane metalloprotease [Oscillospiraceae bacterium]
MNGGQNPDGLQERPPLRPGDFGSRMTRGETAAVLLYFPLHLWLLPLLLLGLPQTRGLSETDINLAVYGFAFLYMLVFAGRFLRRDFDPLCDHFGYCLLQVVISYGMMLAFNMILNVVLQTALPAENPNNAAVADMAGAEYGKTAAMSIFLAPVAEELMFRGAVFGGLRRYSRPLAYAASMLLFSLYHVWGFALLNPVYWIFLLQYLPVSWLLCRCYERCGSIWGSILFHALINAVSVRVLVALGG